MKKKIFGIIALMLAMVMALTSCAYVNMALDFIKELISPSVALTDPGLEAEKLIDFKDGANPDVLFESDGWSNGDVFNVVWKSHNVVYENGIMRLGITEEKASAWIDGADVEYNYTAGEARTQNYYHYGDYEVSMKPSANPGTASTFFVCTGPYDLKDGVPNAHDEIDIEFLGQDTTHVQFNFFVDGKGGNEYMYDLGFDASKEFHTYGFRWAEDSITWFVDGVPVYKVTTDKTATAAGNLRIVEKLPSTAGRILTNYWCGNERAWGWMGKYVGPTKDNGTEYQWIATSAEGAPLNPPVVNPPAGGGEDEEIDWAGIAPIAPEFPDAAPYDVTVEGTKANVVYTDVSGSAYMPIELDVTDAVAGKNYVYMKVTNNGTETVNVRVNMFDPTLTGNNKATNISATMNGVAVRTDLDWGGSFFDIPAGESAELVVHFGVGGVKLQLMIDSSRNDSVLRSGDITVEDIKFAAVGEVEIPHKCEDLDEDGKCDGCGENMPEPPAPAPEDPTSGDLTVMIGGVEVQLGGNTTDGYGVHANDEDNTVKVLYTNISTNTYKNVWAAISAVAEGKNEISLKIKNNGEATAYITVKLETATASALMEGKMEIPAGEEQTYTGTFSGVADKLYLFIDSGWSADNTTHAGEVVISDIVFSGEGTEEPPVGGDPVEPPVESGLQLEFWTSSNDYTANGNNIKYNGAGNSYSCAGSDVSAHAVGKNTFVVTITNNGAETSRVRVDIQGTNLVGNHAVLNTSATGGDVWTNMEWGGSTVTVAAGESVTLVITYDESTERGIATNLVVFVDSGRGDDETYNSDVTLSGMSFSWVDGEEPAPEHSCEHVCAECGKCTDECEEEACAEKCEGHEVVVPPVHECEHKCEECGKCTDECEEEACAEKCEGHEVVVPPVVGEWLKYAGNDCYTFDRESYLEEITFTYENVSTNTYQNVNTWIKDKAAGKATLDLYIVNNGTETVYVTVKLEAAGAVALAEEKVYVAAGEVASVTLNFTGEAEMLYFFIDTGWSENTTSHSGSVTVAGVRFSGEAVEPPVGGDDPVTPPAGDGLQLNFWTSNNSYITNGNNIKYSGTGSSYACAGSADIVSHAAGKTTFTVTITNNGSETSRVRIDIQGTTQVGNHKVLNTSATGGDVWTDMEWGGSTVTVAAGESVTLVITYNENTDRGAVTNLVVFVDSARGDSNTYNSDVTLSGMSFN